MAKTPEKVKPEVRDTVIRVVHNRENPFVQLNKKALWDENLSLKAVGLWARCMSRPDDWKFSIKELAEKSKEGRRAIDSAMRELIDNDYAIRLQIDVKSDTGKFSHHIVEYVFFEFPATQEEKAEQEEIFKKFFRDCGFGNCRNVHLLIKSSKEKDKEEESLPIPSLPNPEPKAAVAAVEKKSEPPEKTKDPDCSPIAQEIARGLSECLHEKNPDWIKPKNLSAMGMQVQKMLLEGRHATKILEVFKWAVNDDFWIDKMSKPNPAKYLRDHFAQLSAKMNAKPKIQEVDRRLREKDGSVADAWKDDLF